MLLLLLDLEHGIAAARTRQHTQEGVGLRGSSLESFVLSSPTPPSPTTPKPTPHPTKNWDLVTEWPTQYPTILPTFDPETDMPTVSASSYVPTSETSLPTSFPTSGPTSEASADFLRTFSGGNAGSITSSSSGTSDGSGNNNNEDAIAKTADPNPTDSTDCPPNTQLFQLDLRTDDYPCETSWVLEKLQTSGEYIVLDEHTGHFYDAHSIGADSKCLQPGKYKFTIYDVYGDGLSYPGYYLLALDGVLFGGSSDFGYEESTTFTVRSASSESAAGVDTAADGMAAEVAPSSEEDESATFAVIEDGMIISTTNNKNNENPRVEEKPVVSYSDPERPSLVEQPPSDQHQTDLVITDVIQDAVAADVPPPSTQTTTWIELLSDDFEESTDGLFMTCSSHDLPIMHDREIHLSLKDYHAQDKYIFELKE